MNQDNYNIARKILKLSFIAHDVETVEFVLNEIFNEKKITIDDDSSILPIDIYSYIFARFPLWIIHYEAYLHDYINPIITYLVVDRMRSKLNEAKKREIQEVCFYAQNLYDDEKAESFSHAVNSAVKVYIEKEWLTPFGFVNVFTEYFHEID